MARRPYVVIALEILLRVLAILLGSLPALISASVALGTIKHTPHYQDNDHVKTDVDFHYPDRSRIDQEHKEFYSATGVTIGITGLAIVLEVMFIVVRLLTLQVDIGISFFLAAGHNVGGSMLDLNAGDAYDISSNQDDIYRITNSMFSSAAFCYNATYLFIILGVCMILLLLRDLNKTTTNAALLNDA